MNIRKFAGILSISMLSILLMAASAAALEDVPKLPMIADGDVKINGQPAPVNTIVTAYDGVKSLGTVKLTAPGVFEDKNILTISEPSGEIQFLIQSPTMTKSVKAQQTFDNWQSGENIHLSLTATYVAGNSGTDSSSSGGGRGSSGTISGAGNDDSVAGGSGDDVASAKDKTQTSSEDLSFSTGSDGSEGSGYSMLLLVLAVIIIAAVGVVYYIRSKNL